MKLNVFQSNSGDCLLISGGGHHILVDGGLKGSYKEFVRPELATIIGKDEKLDLVCVSHIDSDHISGIIQLMDDVRAWRVYNYQAAQKNKKFDRPDFPEPPEISEIWHNAFVTQVGDVRVEFEEMVTKQIQASVVSQNDLLVQATQNLITGEKQAIELSTMVDASLLNIKLNQPTNGEPLVLQEDNLLTYRIGNMNLHLLGPFQDDLERMHQEWNVWLKANNRKLQSLQEKVEESKSRMGLTAEAALGLTIQALTAELGNRSDVTIPNLASITFLVEENGRRILMTGDAHANEILKGLRFHGFLPKEGGTMPVDVLKIQNHGANANIDAAFCKTITADHYVICGNGSHGNPELEVIELVVNSRLEENSTLAPFTFWFNSSEADAETEKQAEHMQKVRQKVEELAKGREEIISFNFSDGQPTLDIELGDG